MKLIPISANVLVNPECISCIEQKNTRGVELTYVWVDGKSYILEFPLDKFYEDLGIGEFSQSTVQQFAG